MNVDIAHIRALKSKGPRHNSDMTDEERNSFENLILLCRPHHRTVDQTRPADFPVSLLQAWKVSKESSGMSALKGVGELTEERVQELLTSSMKAFNEQVRLAVNKLEDVDFEAATVLRSLLDELQDSAHGRNIVDQDTAAMLLEASRGFGNLEDVASTLHSAADLLTGIEDTANDLQDAATKLQEMEDLVNLVNQAANRLKKARDMF